MLTSVYLPSPTEMIKLSVTDGKLENDTFLSLSCLFVRPRVYSFHISLQSMKHSLSLLCFHALDITAKLQQRT